MNTLPLVGLDPAAYPTDDQGFLYDEDVLASMVRQLRPSTIVEVGSWKGHSANLMADTARAAGFYTHIVCVDTWLGSLEHYTDPVWRQELHVSAGRPTLYERFVGNVLARGNARHITPLPLPSVTAAQVLQANNMAADLIYIDGSHEYEDVLADLRVYWPLLSQHGVMFGDDVRHGPVRAAVSKFAEELGLGITEHGGKWRFWTPEAADAAGLPWPAEAA